MMKFFLTVLVTVLSSASVFAASSEKINFEFNQADVTELIKAYSKASGQKFIVDPQVRGKITIFNPGPVTLEEAFNQLSSALAVNGLAISTQGDQMIVQTARVVQRSLIEVGTTLPPLKPEKMFMWTVQLKHVNADDVNKQLRILTSKDGELVPYTPTNQILITDWVSNLHRISKLMGELDRPVNGKIPPPIEPAPTGKKPPHYKSEGK